MKGRIYKDKRGYWIVRFGRDITRTFKDEREAERALTGMRYEEDRGVFDPRDYMKAKPLAFDTLAQRWLEIKKQEVKPRSFNNLNNYMGKAVRAWGKTNIKLIGYAEIEDLIFSNKLSPKTRSNMRSCLHDFFSWAVKREGKRKGFPKIEMPEFPEITFELGWRKITDKETQEKIVDEVKRLSYSINPKIWLGIKFLTTYVKIRPGELINIKDEHINLESGFIVIPHPKEKKPKFVYLLNEDIELIRSLPRSLPGLYFFRHIKGCKGIIAGTPFGPKFLKTWWDRACKNLGVEGVGLYAGTKHTTVTALGSVLSPEQIKRGGTGHTTNKAFERYMLPDKNEAIKVAQKAVSLTKDSKQHLNNIIEIGEARKLNNNKG